MLRRWVPAGLLLSSVATMSATSLAEKAQAKPVAPSTASPAAKPAAPAPDPKAAALPQLPAPDPKAATSADSDKEATRLLEEGRKAHKAGQFDKAREMFVVAYK